MNKPSIPLASAKKVKFLQHIILLILFSSTALYSQIGLGTLATINHPGLLESSKYEIHFEVGTGYGFFVRHDVYDSSSTNIDFRYNAVVMQHKANLLQGEQAEYDFSNFSIEAMISFLSDVHSSFYGGVGIGLLSIISKDKFRATYTDQTIYPVLFTGWSYNWAKGFDLFMELKTGIGESKAGPESIPVTGLAFNLGLTMYITE